MHVRSQSPPDCCHPLFPGFWNCLSEGWWRRGLARPHPCADPLSETGASWWTRVVASSLGRRSQTLGVEQSGRRAGGHPSLITACPKLPTMPWRTWARWATAWSTSSNLSADARPSRRTTTPLPPQAPSLSPQKQGQSWGKRLPWRPPLTLTPTASTPPAALSRVLQQIRGPPMMKRGTSLQSRRSKAGPSEGEAPQKGSPQIHRRSTQETLLQAGRPRSSSTTDTPSSPALADMLLTSGYHSTEEADRVSATWTAQVCQGDFFHDYAVMVIVGGQAAISQSFMDRKVMLDSKKIMNLF